MRHARGVRGVIAVAVIRGTMSPLLLPPTSLHLPVDARADGRAVLQSRP